MGLSYDIIIFSSLALTLLDYEFTALLTVEIPETLVPPTPLLTAPPSVLLRVDVQ